MSPIDIEFENRLKEPIELGFKQEWQNPQETGERFIDFALWYNENYNNNEKFKIFNPQIQNEDFTGIVRIDNWKDSLFGEKTPYDYCYIENGKIRYLQRRKVGEDLNKKFIRNDSIFMKNGFSIHRTYSSKLTNKTILSNTNKNVPFSDHDKEATPLEKVYRLGNWALDNLKILYQELEPEKVNVFIYGKKDSCIKMSFDKNSNIKYNTIPEVVRIHKDLFYDEEKLLNFLGNEKIDSFRMGYNTSDEKMNFEEAFGKIKSL